MVGFQLLNTVIGIQNATFPASVNQYYILNNDIDHARILVVDIPDLDVPSTRVIVNDWFYFIAYPSGATSR
jgi:hypothetical protein